MMVVGLNPEAIAYAEALELLWNVPALDPYLQWKPTSTAVTTWLREEWLP